MNDLDDDFRPASVPTGPAALASVEVEPPIVLTSSEVSVHVDVEIQKIFDENRLGDLKKFLHRRKQLNKANMIFEYSFHVVQTSGILITTIAAGYDAKFLVWVGAGISALASMIKVFESTNNTMLKKLMNDISLIRAGTYVDEGTIVDEEKK